VFEFALLAKQWFENGDSIDKKVILKAIGVNPILLDQKLDYQPRFIFLKIKDGVKKAIDENGRRDLEKSPSNQTKLKNFVKSSLWCTIWDDVRTYLTSSIDPKEKSSLMIAFSHFKKE